jgi:hypothetical protein
MNNKQNFHTEQFLFHRDTIRVDCLYSSYGDLRFPPEINYFLIYDDIYYIQSFTNLMVSLLVISMNSGRNSE